MKLPSFGFGRTQAPEEPEVGPAQPGVSVVLMVDDEPAVRGLFATTIRREGYHVVEARNGVEALDVTAKAGRVDLVVTDVVMPVMKGPELAERLRDQYPDLPFIFVSGYLVDENLGPNAYMLQKPFKRDELLQKINDLIGPARPGAAN